MNETDSASIGDGMHVMVMETRISTGLYPGEPGDSGASETDVRLQKLPGTLYILCVCAGVGEGCL